MQPVPDPPRPGQRSVWSFPRPAIAEPCICRLRIVHRGIVLADSRRTVRTLETSHPPSYYVPPNDVATGHLQPSSRNSVCEWKGSTRYFDVVLPGATMRDVAWAYPHPTPAFVLLAGHLAFYAAPFDEVTLDGERVVPQPGGFYGGWITADLAGPFKGGPGSAFW